MNNTINKNTANLDDLMGESYRQTPTCERLLLNWVDKEFKHSSELKGDGTNNLNNSEFCLKAAAALIANHSENTFSEEDFHKYCVPFPDIDYKWKHDFFHRFVTMLVQNDRCAIIHGVYDFPVYQLR